MDEDRFRRYYAAVCVAHDESQSSDLKIRARGKRQLAQALDLILLEADAKQSGQVAWAMDNGYPEYEILALVELSI